MFKYNWLYKGKTTKNLYIYRGKSTGIVFSKRTKEVKRCGITSPSEYDEIGPVTTLTTMLYNIEEILVSMFDKK